jgi:hypothetical protein
MVNTVVYNVKEIYDAGKVIIIDYIEKEMFNNYTRILKVSIVNNNDPILNKYYKVPVINTVNTWRDAYIRDLCITSELNEYEDNGLNHIKIVGYSGVNTYDNRKIYVKDAITAYYYATLIETFCDTQNVSINYGKGE